MNRKIKIILLVICILSFGVMALGSGESDSDGKDVGNVTTAEKNTITIEEQLLFDTEGIKVTATEYVTDSIWGDGIKLLIENNSDKSVTLSCDVLIVNNYMISDLFVSDIAPGKKSNETLYLSSSELKAAGIESVGQVEIYFYTYDTETYDRIFEFDAVTIKTSEFDTMDTTADNVGTELYNENGIRIVGKTVDEDSFWGAAILLYCENTTGKNVSLYVDEMSINGFMMTPYFYTTIYDQKKSIDDITILSTELEENGIEKIEDVELKFHVYDNDTLDTIVDTQAISFTVE